MPIALQLRLFDVLPGVLLQSECRHKITRGLGLEGSTDLSLEVVSSDSPQLSHLHITSTVLSYHGRETFTPCGSISTAHDGEVPRLDPGGWILRKMGPHKLNTQLRTVEWLLTRLTDIEDQAQVGIARSLKGLVQDNVTHLHSSTLLRYIMNVGNSEIPSYT